MIFEDGVWNLDNDGNEISKTRSVQLKINLNMMYMSTPLDAFEIYMIGKTSKYCDIENLIGKKISFNISNVFFSNFNNTLLIDCDDGKVQYFIQICNCNGIEINESVNV